MKLRIIIKLLTPIALYSTLISCNGQEKKAKIDNEVNTSDSKLLKGEETLDSVILPDFTNQIAETVRVMFQDSKGVFWFGTH